MHKTLKAMFAACGMALCFAVPAFAGEISSVSVEIKPEVLEMQPGDMLDTLTEPVVTSSSYYIDSWTTEGGLSEMVSYYYLVTLVPTGDDTFNTKSFSASVTGGSQVTIKSLHEGKVELKIKCYPYLRLDNPSGIEESDNGYKWKKVSHAKKYNVVIYGTDEEGDEKVIRQTTDSNSINLSKYEDYDFESVSVQAIPGSNDEEWKYVLPSEYVDESNEVNYDESSHISSFNYPSASTSKNKNDNSAKNGAHASKTANEPVKETFGWIKAPHGTWWKNPDGTWPANRWMMIQDKWYLFDANGYRVEDKWVLWNGAYYRLDKDGAMYQNTTTPDGFKVDNNGVWVNN